MRRSQFCCSDFNPRPHKGDDNPRPHKGDDCLAQSSFLCFCRFQSTSPQGGRLPSTTAFLEQDFISIHVPTRGTTNILLSMDFIDIFQSTSPQGGRPIVLVICCKSFDFNPRPHKGDDALIGPMIDILTRFQSTSPQGGRLQTLFLNQERMIFQSTSPQGGRQQNITNISDNPILNYA